MFVMRSITRDRPRLPTTRLIPILVSGTHPLPGGLMVDLHKRAFALSVFTVAYNIVEAILSLIAAALSGSTALAGFGLDSIVESLSGSIMIWRLSQHGRVSDDAEERIEARAVRLIGWTFFIFAAYVIYDSGTALWFREHPEPSLFGILIAVASLIIMPVLYLYKTRTGRAMGSRSLVADAKETLACSLLSAALLAGLGLNRLFGIWWADPSAGLVIAGFLIREGFETLEGDED